MTGFGLDPRGGVVYVMQPNGDKPLSVVASSVAHSPLSGVLSSAGQVYGIDSNETFIRTSASAINSTQVLAWVGCARQIIGCDGCCDVDAPAGQD